MDNSDVAYFQKLLEQAIQRQDHSMIAFYTERVKAQTAPAVLHSDPYGGI